MTDFAVLRRLAPLFIALGLVLAALPARAVGLALTYEFQTGGFSVGTVAVDLAVGDGRYRIRSVLTTTGMIGWMTGFVSDAETEGRIGGGRALPLAHRVDNLWRGDKRWVRAGYSGKLPAFEVSPLPADDDRPDVPAEQTADTVDPLSAALNLALAAADPRPGRLIPVYDGRRRYDLIVQGLAADELREPLYAGPATRLDLRWTRNGGFARPKMFMPSNLPDTAVMWFAPPRPETLGLPLPVRIESDSPFGMTIIRLVRLEPR